MDGLVLGILVERPTHGDPLRLVHKVVARVMDTVGR